MALDSNEAGKLDYRKPSTLEIELSSSLLPPAKPAGLLPPFLLGVIEISCVAGSLLRRHYGTSLARRTSMRFSAIERASQDPCR